MTEKQKYRTFQFRFKTYLDKPTRNNYYAILREFKKTKDERLQSLLIDKFNEIQNLPNFDKSKFHYLK